MGITTTGGTTTHRSTSVSQQISIGRNKDSSVRHNTFRPSKVINSSPVQTTFSNRNRQQQRPLWQTGIVLFLVLAVVILSCLWLLNTWSTNNMGILSFLKPVSRSSAIDSTRLSSTQTPMRHTVSSTIDRSRLEAVVHAALWSFFAGDALSSPTHWFYGGFPQVQQFYGNAGITGYTKPVWELPGSILNKSNLSGGGRSNISGRSDPLQPVLPTIIGDVINHGKQNLWSPSKQIHYHATLEAGENTLEVQLARVLMKSLADNQGIFNADHFRQAYVSFMTTPGSHNDTYASTCHRMFFANMIYKKLPPAQCPDNDAHNVDTIDGLVLPTITALSIALRPDGTLQQAAQEAAATVSVTRNSPLLEQYAAAWAKLVFTTVRDSAATETSAASPNASFVQSRVKDMAQSLGLRTPQVRSRDEITACYLHSAVPALLDTIVKYAATTTTTSSSSNYDSVWQGLLSNANTGGENVHRGSCLGAILGAAAAAGAATSNTIIPMESPLVQGLYHRDVLQQEIETFIAAAAAATTTSSKSQVNEM